MKAGRMGIHIAVIAIMGLLTMGKSNGYAWEPNAGDLDAAIKSGDFAGYHANASAWVSRKVPAEPAKISDAAMKDLLADPVFVNTLDQSQLIAKVGVTELNAFAKANPANAEFLAWLLKNTQVMTMFLESVGSVVIADREKNSDTVSIDVLDRWQKILSADPDAREGICLKLAMATAIAPPHSIGAGTAKVLPNFMDRYKYFKAAQKNNELFPSFNNLTVWEYTKVVSSGASDSDLTWGRAMINTWRPDLKVKEQVFLSTSEVWRRNSPIEFEGCFTNVLAGGGKCGPRSSWTVFICQAWGIPAIGVGQPAHACATAKTACYDEQPQPGNPWKVLQGRGWQVSRLEGTTGPVFVEAVMEREHRAEFTQVDHLRRLASTLASKDAADAVRAVAGKIMATAPKLGPSPVYVPAPEVPEEPFKVAAGTIHLEAESFTNSFADPVYPGEQKGCLFVYNCTTGGKQLNFPRNMKNAWADYAIDVPAAGTYSADVRVAVVNVGQMLNFSSGTNTLATLKIANTTGLWSTQSVDVKLEKGPQILRISAAPQQRGMAIRWIELKAK